jgi:hypothetical protein
MKDNILYEFLHTLDIGHFEEADELYGELKYEIENYRQSHPGAGMPGKEYVYEPDKQGLFIPRYE